jgi:hypothetical protein
MLIPARRCIPHAFRGAAVALCAASSALAQSDTSPMPFSRRAAGWLVSDTNLKKVYLCRDLNGDGTFNQPGEVTVFFDGANAAGLPANAADAVFSMYQAANGTVYIGNGPTKTVYALRDSDLNGDAQGATESRVFFADALVTGGNAVGLTMPTPNGICGDSGAIYICNAGTGSSPQDGVLRVRDTDADGNANGAGESSLFCDSSMLFGTTSSPFACASAGGDIFFADLRGASADVIYRCHDANGDHAIDATEFNIYLADGFGGAPAGFTCKSDGASIYTAENTGGVNPQTVYRLHDDDASGAIDVTTEATLVWSEANLPAGSIMANSFDMDVAPRALLVLSNIDNGRELILARDLNNNGLFTDAGETGVALLNTTNTNTVFPYTPRAVMAYGWPCAADFNMTGGLTVADIFDFLAAWFAGDSRADFNGQNGLGVQDIFDFLGAWFAGC